MHQTVRQNSSEQHATCKAEGQLFDQTNYDELTGLPNHRLFRDFVEKALLRARRWHRHETVLFVDIDCFSETRDTLGHGAGNALLKEVAIRMSGVLRESDLVARYSGDEFAILLDDHSEDFRSASDRVATKILDVFSAPFSYNSQDIEVAGSIGVATYPLSGTDFDGLMKSADAAMCEAKSKGGGQFCFASLLAYKRPTHDCI